jgi:hypothetical protein
MGCVRFLAGLALAVASLPIAACTTSDSGSGAVPDAGEAGVTPDAGSDGGGTATCTGVVHQPPPFTNACTGDPAQCLSGTAGTGFIASPSHRCASVYRTFPQGTAQPVQTQLIATDNTWAFDGLSPWAHYYVVLVDDFETATGGSSVPSIVGPLTVPAGPADAGALDASVKPVQVALLQSKAPGGSWQVQWASAHVFDPSLGEELLTAQVSVDIGGASTAMPWQSAEAGLGASSYWVEFAQSPAAQPSYSVLTADPALGSRPVAWTLLADPPSFEGSITSPADGATVAASAPLAVTWAAVPDADFELTELFVRSDAGAWAGAYTSPQPNDATLATETIPAAALPPGHYLLNLAFAKANCPVAADGCVLASAIAAVQFTAQ